jgi:hypothetical protein
MVMSHKQRLQAWYPFVFYDIYIFFLSASQPIAGSYSQPFSGL